MKIECKWTEIILKSTQLMPYPNDNPIQLDENPIKDNETDQDLGQ